MVYDVVIFVHALNSPCLHKYIHLNKHFNKNNLKSCLILDSSSKWGADTASINNCIENDKDCGKDVYNFKTMSESLNFLNSLSYKISLIPSNFYKANTSIGNRHVAITNQKNATPIQISDHGVDFYICDSVNNFQLSTKYYEKTVFYDRVLKKRNSTIGYSGCLNWDKVENCLPVYYTKNEFCKKYNLNPARPIVAWAPSSVARTVLDGASEAYKEVTKLNNVILKHHPSEYKRHKAHKIGGKWTHEVYSTKPTAVLEPEDTHWWYKYSDVMLTYNSTISNETLMYDLPIVYLDANKEENCLFSKDIPNEFRNQYIFAGKTCDVKNLKNFIINEDYKVNESIFEETKKIIFEGLESYYFYDNITKKVKDLL